MLLLMLPVQGPHAGGSSKSGALNGPFSQLYSIGRKNKEALGLPVLPNSPHCTLPFSSHSSTLPFVRQRPLRLATRGRDAQPPTPAQPHVHIPGLLCFTALSLSSRAPETFPRCPLELAVIVSRILLFSTSLL